MNLATFVILAMGATLFFLRLCIGPSLADRDGICADASVFTLADRVTALNGLVLVGMAAIATQAAHSGVGSFLPTLVAIALVGPIGNGMIARFIEARQS